MKYALETALTAVLALCAVVITAMIVRREFFPPVTDAQIERKPIFLAAWRSHLAAGERIGPADAPMQLLEFGDYQCPFCARFHRDFETLRERFPVNVALTYVHYPLPSHQFAESAARAAECAKVQGRFEAFHNRLFQGQNKLGDKSFTEMAKESGVLDMTTFEVCIKSEAAIPLVVQGKRLGAELNVQGTPTIIVNGWMLVRPPSATELESMMNAILAGKTPIAAGS